MRLLTVDEVTERWRCNRITVLRLMKNHTLRWLEDEAGEPLFEEAEIRKIKNPHTAQPRLRLLKRRENVSLARTSPGFDLEELAIRLARLNAEAQNLHMLAATLRADSIHLLERSRRAGDDILEVRYLARRISLEARALRESGAAPPPPTASRIG